MGFLKLRVWVQVLDQNLFLGEAKCCGINATEIVVMSWAPTGKQTGENQTRNIFISLSHVF
jgi:hypothetical protein